MISGRLAGMVFAIGILISTPALGNEADLATAARVSDWAAVLALVDDGVDVNAEDLDGNRALHWAVRSDAAEAAGRLLESGADPAVENRHGVTPLYLAAENGNASIARLLIEAGADPNQVDRTGETILMIATQTGDAETVRVLLDHGADVKATDPEFGQTALMWAARGDRPGLVEMLIDHGSDVTARTRRGETPAPRLPCIGRTGCGSHGLGIIRGGLPERGKRAPIPWRDDAPDVRRPGGADRIGAALAGSRSGRERCRCERHRASASCDRQLSN